MGAASGCSLPSFLFVLVLVLEYFPKIENENEDEDEGRTLAQALCQIHRQHLGGHTFFFVYRRPEGNMTKEKLNSGQKALQINLDAKRYGTFAEIGAGQEVARWFFHVGKASGTVAKTISAYDMAVSDAIYGVAERYVSRRRLQAMLDLEYNLLIERLDKTRGDKCTFFVFADTVTTKHISKSGEEGGQGWLGVKFQTVPQAEPSQIMIHMRALDWETQRQQEAIGILGVNLLHAAFYYTQDPVALISSLLDGLTSQRVEVDMIKFSGPAVHQVDNRLMALQLVEQWLTEAALFTASGESVIPSDWIAWLTAAMPTRRMRRFVAVLSLMLIVR